MIVPATATNALDIGSGVGLPGIPLAILRPETEFLLIDRSEKRCDLASRAINVVGLSNVTVQQRDVTEQQGEYDAMTMRAALKQAAALPHIARLMSPRGVAAVGLRRTRSDPTDLVDLADLADLYNLDLELVPVPVLDSPATLLRMTRRDPII
jgi:16S rRNA G527 N7-methylase RsmG